MAITTINGATASDFTTLKGTENADTFALVGDLLYVDALAGNDTLTAANAVDNISIGVFAQLVQSQRGALVSADGGFNYSEALRQVATPFLLIAGPLDHLAPPQSVMAAYDRLASQNKRLVVASQANGFADNYGHVDLVLGERAPDEIYPLLFDWLEQNDE